MSNRMAIVLPKISEKAYILSQDNNIYLFDVPVSMNKTEIRKSIEEQFKVAVTNVNTSKLKGKSVQSYRRKGGRIDGRRSDRKRAYVTLKEGSSLPFFEESN